MNTSFYEFRQNNSGGGFDVDNKLCERMFIEAGSYEQAEEIAESFGVYYDGVEKGIDCDCCGDRWRSPDIVDLNSLNEKGWEVVSFNSESEWNYKYGKYEIVEEPEWVKVTWNAYRGKIKFKDIEEYATFLNREYSISNSTVRIFYLDGRVKEFIK